jgi:hypothetical protein
MASARRAATLITLIMNNSSGLLRSKSLCPELRLSRTKNDGGGVNGAYGWNGIVAQFEREIETRAVTEGLSAAAPLPMGC